jgi:diguanylate cyclase (GGDEF)-like protein/PAS domain S-box-containing protein
MAKALTMRYVVALVLVALLSTGAWVSLYLVIDAQESSAALVNISGRQRMLSQRTALYATLLARADTQNAPTLQERLAASVELMARSHQGLTEGNPDMGLPATLSPTVRALYFSEPLALDAHVRSYLNLLEQWLTLPPGQWEPEHPLLQRITAVATGDLLNRLDHAVGQYQREGEQAVAQLHRIETGLWLATLLLLLLEAGLIFRPFTRHIKAVIAQLEAKRTALRLQRDTLEQTVAERTQELQGQLKALEVRNTALQQIPQGVLFSGPDHRIAYANPGFEATTGYSPGDIVGQTCRMLQGPETDPAEVQRIAETLHATRDYRGTLLNYRKDGRPFWNDLSICPARGADGQLIGFVGVLHDVTEHKLRESTFWAQAHHDALTGLPNRLMLIDRWHLAVSRCARYQQHGALLYLDLNRFKPLNDHHGHEYGDQLLIQVGQRLTAVVRDLDTVVRLGGDEFVVLLTELNTDPVLAEQQARQVIGKIHASLATPYILRPSTAEAVHWNGVGAAIGLALFNGQHMHLDSALQAADQAMYREKDRSRPDN